MWVSALLVLSWAHDMKEEAPGVYRCEVCGYTYRDAVELAKGRVPFALLPSDWTCPDCGVGKEEFEKVEIPSYIHEL